MKIQNLMIASILAGGMVFVNVGGALAQTGPPHQMMQGDISSLVKSMQETPDNKIPKLPGQDAFGAIQEIVSILEADPSTDWSLVDISSLRSHLIDMNLLVMNAGVNEKTLDGGLEMVITGQDRTRQAIIAMVLAHAPMINGLNGWNVKAKVKTDQVKLTVTSTDVKEISHIQGLGFFGLMVSDSHHQTHHLGLARGKNVHAQ